MKEAKAKLKLKPLPDKDNSEQIKRLLESSKSAILGALELHNKPVFPYRYIY